MTRPRAIEGTGPSPPGNSKEWNAIWADLPPDTEMLFTRGIPKTLLQFWQRAYFEDLWALLGAEAARARCLELGSGRGTTSMYLASKGCAVTLVDLSPEALGRARANFQAQRLPEPKLISRDARDTTLPSESFDCVYNIGLLEHFEDPLPVLRESFRLLSDGGVLFSVVVPVIAERQRWLVRALCAPWQLLTLPLRRFARLILRRSNPSTTAMVRTDYSREQWKGWAQEAGFREAQCVPYNPYHGLWRGYLSVGPFVPLYRLNLSRRKRPPKLATWPSVAMCDLLLARK